jgi:rhodanese-related sulfurtransferase
MTDDIRTITAPELKARIDRGDAFKLVNALGDWEFRAKHIPRSLHLETTEAAVAALRRDDDIVVYCSNPACHSSKQLYKGLVANGYLNVRRFSGGLLEWEDAGYPLEGEDVP